MRLKEILIDSLMLDIDKELIMNDQPLFGRGLELDSIDALELSIGISTTFGVELMMMIWQCCRLSTN